MINKLFKTLIYRIGFNLEINISEKFKKIDNEIDKGKISKYNFGQKNKNIKFYVIKRSPGAGFFSNLLYVILHLEIADKKKMIPIVDMQNFPTVYNQKKNISRKRNIWELYFKQVSKYQISEIYKSKNVYFSPSRYSFFLKDFKKKKLKKVFDKYIIVNNKITQTVNNFVKKNFKNKYVLGIHFRGTDQKVSAGHASPPTMYQITKIIDHKIKNKSVDKVFLFTEDLNYYKSLKKKYGNFICAFNFFRGNNAKDFSNSKRKNHRNRLGIENLVEAITLSKCNEIIYCETNVSLFSIFYSNFNIKKHCIDNGYKSSLYIISRFEWYIKRYLPDKFKEILKI